MTTEEDKLSPADIDAMMQRAMGLHQAGEIEPAGELYREVVAADPKHLGAKHLLGLTRHQLGEPDRAYELISDVVVRCPGNASYLNNLAAVLEELDRSVEALVCYRHAVAVKPDYVDALSNLGRLLLQFGRLPEAEKTLRRCLEIDADHVGARSRLVDVLVQQGDPAAAQAMLEQAVQRLSSGVLWMQLGSLWMSANDGQGAIEAFERAATTMPQDAIAHYNLGSAYAQQQLLEKARESFTRASQLRPQCKSWRYRARAIVPTVFSSSEEIHNFRAELARTLDEAADDPDPFTLDELSTSGFYPPFALAYHGCNNRPLKEKYARLFMETFPRIESYPRNDRLRIGFVVTAQHEGIFLRCMAGLVNRLDRRRFEPILVCSQSSVKPLRDGMKDKTIAVVGFPNSLPKAMDVVRSIGCDIFHYWEICSDSMNYFLPFARLAPVQSTSVGSQITTGIPAVDYFVSSPLMEVEDAQQHYTEQLWLGPTLPMYQQRLAAPQPATRKDFDLPAEGALYMCLQNPLKLHPDSDQLFADVLRADPQGHLVVQGGLTPRARDQLITRHRTCIPDVAGRIRYTPWLPDESYLQLLCLADVVLDAPHYSAGSSAYDMFSLNLPVVTLPGEFCVSRCTAACYWKMGWTELIAETAQNYVSLANRLGQDVEYRRACRNALAELSHPLFNDDSAVEMYAKFFSEISCPDS